MLQTNQSKPDSLLAAIDRFIRLEKGQPIASDLDFFDSFSNSIFKFNLHVYTFLIL